MPLSGADGFPEREEAPAPSEPRALHLAPKARRGRLQDTEGITEGVGFPHFPVSKLC